MSDITKYTIKNPKSKEQKLTSEIIIKLCEVMKKNYTCPSISVNAIIGFAGTMIETIAEEFESHLDALKFLKDVSNHFNMYIQDGINKANNQVE